MSMNSHPCLNRHDFLRLMVINFFSGQEKTFSRLKNGMVLPHSCQTLLISCSIRAASSRILELQVEYYNKRFEDPEVFKRIEFEIAETRASQGDLNDDAVEKRK